MAVLLPALLAGCAEMADPAGKGPVAAAAPIGGGALPLDGRYRGRQIPTGNGFACRGTPREVLFEVRDGLIEMRSSRRRRGVWKPDRAGTVSPGGDVALRGTGEYRLAVGRIEGGRLTASDVPDTVAAQEGRSICSYHYEAVRE
jgi:hypothetical protein